MSLVSSYVQAQSGEWYQDPRATNDARTWFICWDDDDPIELVVRQEVLDGRLSLQDFLSTFHVLGWQMDVIRDCGSGSRVFHPNTWEFIPARSWFLRTLSGGPPDNLLKDYERKFKHQPEEQGVYYALTPRGDVHGNS